ncbi:MAG: septation protein IspZ [Chlamydiales bacterium]|nr:septation protein IspZ [Chlamydiales bacterium]
MNLKDTITKIFNLNFLLSVVIPIIIFCVLSHFNMILLGTILAGSWALVAIVFQYTRERKINIFAIIVASFSIIGLFGTIIFHNPTFYLESPILMDLVLGCIFLGSLLIGKPLVQIFAEYEMKDAFSQKLRMHPKYVSAWKILTAGWGLICMSQALLRLALLHTASPEVYYSISSVYGNVSTPLFLLFTFWFPKWYWRDLRTNGVREHGSQNSAQ